MEKDRQTLKEIAEKYMQVWNAGKEDILDNLADKKLNVNYPHFEKTYKGIPAYKSILKITHNYFPDLEITLNRVIPDSKENCVTVLWQYTGTHKNGDLFGTKPSGKKVTVRGMTLLEIENGLVKSEKGVVDNLGLVMQLEAFP